MRVQTENYQVYDDTDKRCSVRISACYSVSDGVSYIVFLSCFDAKTGAINYYHGVLPNHLNDYDDESRAALIEQIMDKGGDTWKLLRDLNATQDYHKKL